MDTLISKRQFFVLVDRFTNGTPLGRGWGRYKVSCPYCRAKLTIVRIIGTVGFVCPECQGKTDDIWTDMISQQPCDGGWLEPVGWERGELITNN